MSMQVTPKISYDKKAEENTNNLLNFNKFF